MGTRRRLVVAFLLLAIVSINCGLAQAVADRVRPSGVLARLGADDPTPTQRRATRRPTFTPTPAYTDTPIPTPTPTITPIPTDTLTPIPTNTSPPTNTPVPTDTPVPTNTSPPPPPTDTPTPAPTPTPNWVFKIKEQGNRMWQKTTSPTLSDIFAITDGNGTPLGGFYVVGEHSSGKTYKTPVSDWGFSACTGGAGYGKCGNLKFEPGGGFEDGTWNVYVVDGGGTQLSAKVPLSYSSDPDQWYWDFIWWTK